jgi:type VI secretion system protein VasI
MRLLLGVLAAALCCAEATAQTSLPSSILKGLQICGAVEDTSQRLTCFDVLTKSLPEQDAETADSGKWNVRTTRSPIDDSTNVFLELSGERGIEDQYGRDAEISLHVACRENTTSAYLVFGGHFMSDIQGFGRVTYRIDQQKAQTRNFTESTDHEALGLWNGGSAIPWVKSMFGAKRMYVEATPFSESRVSDFLPISGIENAITPLREACRW